ncbi:MAG: peptidoglycan DD-metalloendopeptidase family protein [Minisyncoccia bacterium]
MWETGDRGESFFPYYLKAWLKNYWKNFAAFFVALVIGLSFVAYEDGFAYKVEIDGKTACITKDSDSVKRLIENLYEKEVKKSGTNVVINQSINYKRIRVSKNLITNPKEIETVISNSLTFDHRSGAIFVDEKFITALKTTEEAKHLLDTIKSKYSKDSDKTYFKENVEVKSLYIDKKNILSFDKALETIQKPAKSSIKYTVKENDNLWTIARDNNMYIEDILKVNPGLTENLMPGQTINLTAEVPIITVISEKKVTYKDEIPFEIKYQKNDSLYTNESKVLKEGEKGTKEIIAIIKCYNGIEVSREIEQEKILTEAVSKVVAVGTKKPPITVATGSFNYPLRGTITSRYGQRWGRLHTGVDIAASEGSPIYAADGGKVIFSGWESGYGYVVKVDHGNRYMTYYGHASKLLVSTGEKVYKGQKIALVGSTGHATGPHLHFEVRIDGVPVNPLPYLH